MKEKKKELQKFLNSGFWYLLILGVLFVVMSIAAIIAGIWMGVFLLLFGALIIWSTLSSQKRIKVMLDEYEKTGELNFILAEYEYGAKYLNGNTRCGNVYILTKSSVEIIRYADIVQVYQKIRKKNFIETNRDLIAVTRDRKTVCIANLKTKNRSEQEMRMIVGEIIKRNPYVKVGYR